MPQGEAQTGARAPMVRRIMIACAHSLLRRLRASHRIARLRSLVAYRARKAPRDATRLVWFLLRGHGRWIAKAWKWASHGDLRADVRAARLSGDTQARREAHQAIRADAKARWAKAGIVLRRTAIGTAGGLVVLILLALADQLFERAAMPHWLIATYQVRDAVTTVLAACVPWLVVLGPVGWIVAAVWEGRDRTPGAGWLTRPDRGDAESWVDERMISRALAHLGVAPLNAFFKDGGELVYLTPARKDGEGTFARVRLPLGVTADMVADRRATLAANLARASLETWPTKADEDGVLDLWVADKGSLGGGAGDWPLLHEGELDLFDGVPFGRTQRRLVIHAPVLECNWLIGGRPGQGKTSAMRTLLLGAALDPTAEMWAFVMGESPDFDPLTPRLSRYRMGMDDAVAADAVAALAELAEEMERRGRTLGAQPGRPPKVSRKLADRRGLGLHPLVVAIDECHELFGHTTYGKQAEELAVRLIKRGRKYGITLLLATQSPTKDSIPKEITRNIACGVAFAVADHVTNDGLLGAGRYRAGVRATELRMHADRGTCVAVGITDQPWELVRTFYIPFDDDDTDQVTPVIARAMAQLADRGQQVPRPAVTPEQEEPAVDPLADIAHVLGGERRVRTQTVLTRLAAHHPTVYDGWTLTDLAGALAAHGIQPAKSHGIMVIRADDLAAAHTRRAHNDATRPRSEPVGKTPRLPETSPEHTPPVDQEKGQSGSRLPTGATGAWARDNPPQPPAGGDSLPEPADSTPDTESNNATANGGDKREAGRA